MLKLLMSREAIFYFELNYLDFKITHLNCDYHTPHGWSLADRSEMSSSPSPKLLPMPELDK